MKGASFYKLLTKWHVILMQWRCVRRLRLSCLDFRSTAPFTTQVQRRRNIYFRVFIALWYKVSYESRPLGPLCSWGKWRLVCEMVVFDEESWFGINRNIRNNFFVFMSHILNSSPDIDIYIVIFKHLFKFCHNILFSFFHLLFTQFLIEIKSTEHKFCQFHHNILFSMNLLFHRSAS